jgi:N-acetylneuraminic acid mutarotase
MLSLALTLTSLLASDALPGASPRLAAPVGEMSRGLTSFGAEVVDGRAYVFGGYFGKPHEYSSAGQSDAFTSFDPAQPARSTALPGGGAMQGAVLVANGRDLLRVGGMVAENATGEPSRLRSVSSAMRFDTAQQTWSKLPDMPTGRSSHDAECVGSKLVVVGGWTLSPGEAKRFAEDALVLDLAAPSPAWKSYAAPAKRRALSAARLGNRVVAIGGLDADGESTKRVDFFDPATGAWTEGPAFPGEPFGVAACTVGDHVLASGKDGAIWRLDANAAQWQRVGALAFPRFFHQMIAGADGSAWILGGISEMRAEGRVKHIERFVETAAEPTVGAFEIDAPLVAKNRFGLLVDGDRALFFGGNRSLQQHDFKPDDFQDGCFELDLGTFAWTKRTELPERRQTFATIMRNGEEAGLAVGGFGTTEDRATAKATAFRWDFAGSTWSPAADLTLPKPRTQFALVQSGNQLFACGGLDYDPARGDDGAFVHPTDVLRFDLADPARGWRDAGFALSNPRRAFAGAVHGGKLYLVGGMREEFTLVDDCEAVDLATGKSTPIAAPRTSRTSASLVEIGGKLYLCGGSSRRGESGLAPDTSIEVYDPQTNSWSVLVEALPYDMRHVQAFALRGRLVLVSAHIEGAPKLRVVIVTPGS